MTFVKVNQDSSLVFPYGFNRLRNDNPGMSFDIAVLTDAQYLPMLASLNVFPVVENPPAVTADQRAVPGGVLFVDPNYVRQYTIVDLSNVDVDERDSGELNWRLFVRRLLTNVGANSPFRQMQTWGLETGKGRYNNTLLEIAMITGTLRSVARLRAVLINLKANLGSDTFTGPQIAEWNNLFGILGVAWTWASL